MTKRYEHVDGYNYEAFIKRVLIGLGFEEAVWDKTAEHAALQAEIEKLMLRWEELMTAAEALQE